jgi:hypothetical protein
LHRRSDSFFAGEQVNLNIYGKKWMIRVRIAIFLKAFFGCCKPSASRGCQNPASAHRRPLKHR